MQFIQQRAFSVSVSFLYMAHFIKSPVSSGLGMAHSTKVFSVTVFGLDMAHSTKVFSVAIQQKRSLSQQVQIWHLKYVESLVKLLMCKSEATQAVPLGTVKKIMSDTSTVLKMNKMKYIVLHVQQCIIHQEQLSILTCWQTNTVHVHGVLYRLGCMC